MLFVGVGWQLKRDSDYLMEFETLTQDFMAQVLMSSQYDHRVMTRVIVTLIGDDPTQLSWRGYLVTNPGSSFERLTEITHNPDGDRVQARFQEIKFKLESA